jgi:CheY-like chemotaxis protein
VLTVDDSRAIRNIVSKQAQEMGFEVEEAENGEEGLTRLAGGGQDLVVLDVTMPVLDGPGMLKRMREGGNKTPVIMLTSEAKSTIIADCMKLGIGDYILKPFKADELRRKICQVLKIAPPAPVASPAAAAAGAAPPAGGGPKAPVGVLVVDDMENVQKKLRSLVPEAISMVGCLTGADALARARESTCSLVLVDLDIPGTDSYALLGQLKILQPKATFVALSLKTLNDVAGECKKHGFHDVLYKPFDQNKLEELLQRSFDDQEIVTVAENTLTLAAFTGKDDRADRYFDRVESQLPAALQKVAAACFEDVLVDIRNLPSRPDRVPRFVGRVAAAAAPLGLSLRLAGPAEIGKLLSSFSETGGVPYFTSVEEARKAS